MKTKLFILLQFLGFSILAQSPSLINYQGAVRDASGQPLANKTIAVNFELLQGTGEKLVFAESQTVTTNALGLFSTQIGKFNSAAIDTINFERGTLSLNLSIDLNAGNNFTFLSKQKLVSVPFSIHAQSVPVTYTNNILTIGKTSFTLNGTGAIYTASTGISIVSNSIITNTAPDQTVTLNSGNSNVNITGAYPDFTVATSPSLTLLAPNTLSISNGNTVDITPGLTFSNGILSVGGTANTVAIPGATTSLQGSGAANVVTLGVNAFSVDVPVTVITPSTNINVGGTYPNFTISSTPSLNIVGQNLDITGGNTIALPNASLVGSGAVTVVSLSPNSYSINVPVPVISPGTNVNVLGSYPNYTVAATPTLNMLGANTLSISGGNSVSIAPSLSMSGNTLTVGPPGNSVIVPSGTFVATNIVPIGVVTATQSGNTFSIQVNPTNITITTLQAAMSVQTISSNNFSVNIPPPITQSLSLTGPNTLSITNGGSVTIAPSLGITNNTLQVGPASNTIVLPTAAAQTLNLLGANTLSISNGNSVTIAPSLGITNNTLQVGPASNTIVLPTAAAQTLNLLGANTLSISNGNSVTIAPSLGITNNTLQVGPASNTIVLPTAAAQTLNLLGANTLSISNGNSVTIAPSLGITNNTLQVGPASNTIVLPIAAAQTLNLLGANTLSISNGNSVTIAPSLGITNNTLQVGPVSNTIVLPIAAAQTLNLLGANTLSISNGNSVTIAPSLGITNNTLQVGPVSNTIVLPIAAAQTLNLLGANTLSISNGNSVTIAPSLGITNNTLQVGPPTNTIVIPIKPNTALTATGGGITINSTGTNSFVLDVPSTTLVPGTNVTINGSHPTYTINAVPTLSLVGNNLTISGGNTVPLPSNTIAAVSVSITGSGAVSVATLGANSYNISSNSQTLNLLGANTLSISNGNSITIAPTLSVTGNVLSVGPLTNTISLPTASNPNIVGGGAASVATVGPNSYSVTVPQTSIVQGTNVTVAGSFPNYTISSAPSLSLTGSSLSISGGNTVTLPAAAVTTVVGSGAVSVVTVNPNSYSITVLPTTITPSTNVSVTGTYPNFTIASVPTLSLTGSSLSINGGNTVTLPAAANASVVGSGAVSVVTVNPNSYSITVPQTSIVQGTNVTVAGSFPNYTISSAPSLSLTGSSLSISGGNTVTLPAAPNTSVVGSGAVNVVTVNPNSYSITVLPTSITPSTNVSVTGTYPNFTVAATPNLSLTGSNLSITGGNTVTLPAAPNTSVVGSGAVNVVTVNPNSYSITVLPTSITPSTNVSVTGTYPNFTVAATPNLSLTGSNLSITGGNTVTLPAAPNTSVVGSGAVNVVTVNPNSYSITVLPTSITPSTNVSVTGTYPNFTVAATPNLSLTGSNLSITGGNTVTLPAAPNTSVVGSGAVNVVTVNPNSYSITVLPTTITPSTNVSVTGTYPNFTVAATPNLSLTGSNLSITGGNTITLPAAPVTTVVGSGAVSVVTVNPNSYSITVPQTSIIQGTNVTVAGSFPNYTISSAPSLSLTGSSLSISGGNTVTLPAAPTLTSAGVATVTGGPNYTVNVAPTTIAITTLAGTASVTASSNNFSINIPAAIAPTITGSGLATATQTGSALNVSVTPYNYTTTTGALGSGTNIINVTQALSLNGTTLTSGPTSNTLNLGSLTPWRQGVSSVTLATNGDFVGIGTNNPTSKLHVVGSGASAATSAFNVQNSATTDMFTILNNGKVGIGTVSPTEELQIQTASTAALSIISHSAAAASLHFGDPNNHYMGTIRYDNSNNSMNFWTNNSPNRMVIDQNGYVGINNVNPNTHLDVIGLGRITSSVLVTGYIMDVQNNNTTLSAQSSGGLSVTNNGDRTIGNNAVTFQNLTTKTAGSGSTKTGLEILSTGTWTGSSGMINRGLYVNATGGGNGNYSAILMGGQVGIGTLTPTEMLDVVGNIKMTGAFKPGNNAGTAGQLLVSTGAASAPTWSTSGLLNNGTTNYLTKWATTTSLSSTSLVYDDGSHVAIGTSITNWNGTTGKVLSVAGSTVYSGYNAGALELIGSSISIFTAVATVDFNSVLSAGSAANIAKISAFRGGSNSMGDLAFSTNNGTTLSERLRITNDGKVGIGTAAPIKKLSIYGSSLSAYDGPHINFVTSADQYPTMEIFNWSHGEQHILFNSYYETGAFKSADINGNFDIANYNTTGLDFRYNNNVTPGTTVNFISGMLLSSNGRLRIGNTGTSVTATLQVNGTTRLVDGTQGVDKMLVSDASGNASWANGSKNTGFAVYASASQAISSSAWTTINFGVEELDSGADFASNSYTAPTAGVYHFDASVSFAGTLNTGQYMMIAFYKGNSILKTSMMTSVLDYQSCNVSATVPLNANDVITVQVYQTTGFTYNTYTAGPQFTYFSGFRLY